MLRFHRRVAVPRPSFHHPTPYDLHFIDQTGDPPECGFPWTVCTAPGYRRGSGVLRGQRRHIERATDVVPEPGPAACCRIDMAKGGKRTVAAWRAAKRGWQPSNICKAEAVLRLAPLGGAEVGRPGQKAGEHEQVACFGPFLGSAAKLSVCFIFEEMRHLPHTSLLDCDILHIFYTTTHATSEGGETGNHKLRAGDRLKNQAQPGSTRHGTASAQQGKGNLSDADRIQVCSPPHLTDSRAQTVEAKNTKNTQTMMRARKCKCNRPTGRWSK
jgi:hypothetical protein